MPLKVLRNGKFVFEPEQTIHLTMGIAKNIPEWQRNMAESLKVRLPFLTNQRRMVFFGVEDQSLLPDNIPFYGGVIHKLFNSSVWMEMSKKTCEELILMLESGDLTKKENYIMKFENSYEWNDNILTVSNMI